MTTNRAQSTLFYPELSIKNTRHQWVGGGISPDLATKPLFQTVPTSTCGLGTISWEEELLYKNPDSQEVKGRILKSSLQK